MSREALRAAGIVGGNSKASPAKPLYSLDAKNVSNLDVLLVDGSTLASPLIAPRLACPVSHAISLLASKFGVAESDCAMFEVVDEGRKKVKGGGGSMEL